VQTLPSQVSTAEELAIETTDLHKTFEFGDVVVTALRGVNLKVRRGEYVSIVGPSGSGKSTLLNMLGALDRPTKGRIIIDEIDITNLSDWGLASFRNRKIGFIFQSFNLVARTTALKNVELPAIVSSVPARIRRERARHLLEMVGLGDKVNRKPNFMSGGEQQRVAIARALINKPAFILADEPTGNLDSKTGSEIAELLREINKEQKATIVMVTHNPELANETDRILHLRDGLIEKESIGIWGKQPTDKERVIPD
jgi:putative ABC transport system ATP-binding protein